MPRSADGITGWEVSSDRATWSPARVPGTVAGAFGRVEGDYDAHDWWFRARVAVAPPVDDEEILLRFDGIATRSDVYLNGELIVESSSMFASHLVDLGTEGVDNNELLIHCHALVPVLAEPRLPRARWRPNIAPSGLRHVRTMMLGRAPGFAPGPAAVGPWRPITIERRRHVSVEDFRLRTSLAGTSGRVDFSATIRPLGEARVRSSALVVTGPTGTYRAPLIDGHLTIPNVVLWWPHTHGEPVLYDARIVVETDNTTVETAHRRVGFRTLENASDLETDGIQLRVNGQPLFARGAVWTPIDFVNLAATAEQYRVVLERVRDAGMNLLRVPGTSAYESPTFHDLCDELGVLVWQDFMFANFDYPIADEQFRAIVTTEARAAIDDLAWRPSLAVLCGNSEVEQQAAMLGRTTTEARGALFGELLPHLIDEAAVDAVYVPSAPCGGDVPFRPGVGVANYFGVGGYRRPLSDVRLADVRFAAECLAFSNVPDDDALTDTNVPRDVGTTWDFADVRDHYAVELYGRDALDRPEVARAVTGEVMADVFGQWRRTGSRCGGALLLWLTDLLPGAGWGVLDHLGAPKLAYFHLRRVLAPVAVWMTDEGLGGLDVHVANDRPLPLSSSLRVAFYRDGETKVDEVAVDVRVGPHTVTRWGVEEILGRFVDASYAYRFGPPAFDVVVATLERAEELLSQAFFFPAGRPRDVEVSSTLGLRIDVGAGDDGMVLNMSCDRVVHGVRIHIPGYEPTDNGFSIEPGTARVMSLRSTGTPVDRDSSFITAVNLAEAVRVEFW